MSNYDDSQIVDYLFDEMSEEDERAFEHAMSEDLALSAEVRELDDALDTYRSVEDVEPSAHLDALILATAREVADETKSEAEEASIFGRFRKYFFSPVAGIVAAASVAVVAGIVLVPTMGRDMAPTSAQEAIPLGSERAPAKNALQQKMIKPVPNTVMESPAPVTAEPSAAAKLMPPTEDLPEATPDEAKDLRAKRSRRPNRRRKTATRRPPPPSAPSRARAVVEETRSFNELGKKEEAAQRKVVKPRRVAPQKKADELLDLSADDVGHSDAPASGGAGTAVGNAAAAGRGARGAPVKQPPMEPAMAPEDEAAPAAEPAPVAPAKPAPQIGGKAQLRTEADRMTRRFGTKASKSTASRERQGGDRSVAAAQVARDMIRAAEQELKRKQVDSARRILSRALTRTRGTPSEGDVLLRMAYLERDERRYAVCVSLASRARSVRGFTRKKEADALVRQVAPLIERTNAPASATPRRE